MGAGRAGPCGMAGAAEGRAIAAAVVARRAAPGVGPQRAACNPCRAVQGRRGDSGALPSAAAAPPMRVPLGGRRGLQGA